MDYLTSVTDASTNRTSPDLAFLQETENFRIRVAADHEVVERVVLEGGRRDFRHALELFLCSGDLTVRDRTADAQDHTHQLDV
jgi:hypothetical protein